jgi:hypothetical protein
MFGLEAHPKSPFKTVDELFAKAVTPHKAGVVISNDTPELGRHVLLEALKKPRQ